MWIKQYCLKRVKKREHLSSIGNKNYSIKFNLLEDETLDARGDTGLFLKCDQKRDQAKSKALKIYFSKILS